jgi:hypothetical protein
MDIKASALWHWAILLTVPLSPQNHANQNTGGLNLGSQSIKDSLFSLLIATKDVEQGEKKARLCYKEGQPIDLRDHAIPLLRETGKGGNTHSLFKLFSSEEKA